MFTQISNLSYYLHLLLSRLNIINGRSEVFSICWLLKKKWRAISLPCFSISKDPYLIPFSVTLLRSAACLIMWMNYLKPFYPILMINHLFPFALALTSPSTTHCFLNLLFLEIFLRIEKIRNKILFFKKRTKDDFVHHHTEEINFPFHVPCYRITHIHFSFFFISAFKFDPKRWVSQCP